MCCHERYGHAWLNKLFRFSGEQYVRFLSVVARLRWRPHGRDKPGDLLSRVRRLVQFDKAGPPTLPRQEPCEEGSTRQQATARWQHRCFVENAKVSVDYWSDAMIICWTYFDNGINSRLVASMQTTYVRNLRILFIRSPFSHYKARGNLIPSTVPQFIQLHKWVTRSRLYGSEV